MEKAPKITIDHVRSVCETKYIKVYDLQYAQGRHYYDATRRNREDIVAVKSDAEAKQMLPDAVSCIVVVEIEGQEPVLLLTREYRYPAGRFLLSVPAGLIDPADREGPDPLIATAVREIREETGIRIGESDSVFVVNPFLYSTPGMSDESNALVGAVIRRKDFSELSQDGAEGTECFDGFVKVTRSHAEELLRSGRDDTGHFYSIFTYAALMWFTGRK